MSGVIFYPHKQRDIFCSKRLFDVFETLDQKSVVTQIRFRIVVDEFKEYYQRNAEILGLLLCPEKRQIIATAYRRLHPVHNKLASRIERMRAKGARVLLGNVRA